MRDGWDSLKLSEVIDIKHGFAFKGEHFSDDAALPTVLTPGNFAIGGGFRAAKTKTYSGPIPEDYVLRAGDLVVSMTDLSKTGDTLGMPAVVPSDGTYLHNQRIGRVFAKNKDRISLKFLGYYLRNRDYQQFIVGTATGSTVRHTSPSKILSHEALLPPLPEQLAIAEVLSAFDDLIDADRDLIASLSAEADLAFLSLRVPGTDTSFGDFCGVKGGSTPSTKEADYWGGSIMWATPTDVTALSSPHLFNTSRTITDKGLANCTSALYPAQSILMTSRATIGAFAITQVPCAVNQGFIVAEPRSEHDKWFLYHEMRNRVEDFIGSANGSTFLEISKSVFKGLSLNVPDVENRVKIHEAVDPLHRAAAALAEEIDDLTETRDALRPLLLSGKISPNSTAKLLEDVTK